MVDKEQVVDEAAAAAAISAEHAVKAAEQAEADDTAARQVAKEKAGNRLCPNCKSEMTQHNDDNPYKAGCWHCNGCGACWAPGLKRMREGHPEPTKAVPVA